MNKKKLIENVESKACTVEIDLDDGRYKTVRIIAPQGKNFGDIHELITAWQSGSASQLYEEAWNDFQESVPFISDCNSENCGSWRDGICEYWQ